MSDNPKSEDCGRPSIKWDEDEEMVFQIPEWAARIINENRHNCVHLTIESVIEEDPNDYTPTTEEIRDGHEVTHQEFDRWLNTVQAAAWDEGSRAGLDAGLAAAETTQQGSLANLPPFSPNPYH